MQQQNESSGHFADVEQLLQQLAPAPARLDVAQTMFRAGQQSVRRPSRWQVIWPLSSACLALLSLTLAVLLTLPAKPRVVDVAQDEPSVKAPHVPNPPTVLADQNGSSSVLSSDRPTTDWPPPRDETLSRPRYGSETTSSIPSPLWGEGGAGGTENTLVAFEPLLSGCDPALDDIWKSVTAQPHGDESSVQAIRYQDWRTLLDDLSLADRLRQPGNSTLLEWTVFLNQRGS